MIEPTGQPAAGTEAPAAPVAAPAPAATAPAPKPEPQTIDEYHAQRDALLSSEPAAPAAPAPVAAAPAVPDADAVKAAEAEANSTKPDAELSEAGRKLRSHRVDARTKGVREDIAQLNAALQERARLREQLAALATQPQPGQQPPAQPQPRPGQLAPQFPAFVAWIADPANDGKEYEDYLDARNDFRREQVASAERARAEHAQAQRALMTSVARFDELAKPYRAEFADFDAVVNHLALTPEMRQVMNVDEYGPLVIRHLGVNPSEYQRVAAMPPARALFELARIHATLAASRQTAAAAHPVTSAPAPHTPVGQSGATAGQQAGTPSIGSSLAEYEANRARLLASRS